MRNFSHSNRESSWDRQGKWTQDVRREKNRGCDSLRLTSPRPPTREKFRFFHETFGTVLTKQTHGEGVRREASGNGGAEARGARSRGKSSSRGCECLISAGFRGLIRVGRISPAPRRETGKWMHEMQNRGARGTNRDARSFSFLWVAPVRPALRLSRFRAFVSDRKHQRSGFSSFGK